MIYIHVPFCLSRCTYCDFYSQTDCRAEAFERYTSGICDEIARRRAGIDATLDLNTLYIGGGTPSVLPLPYLERIVTALGCGPYSEFTVEVNPDDIVGKGPEYLDGLRALGVNRISMGVQSLDDGILRWMNRRHGATGAREAFRIVSNTSPAGFDRSIDLITGVPGMTDKILGETLDEVLEWRPEHISAYQLSVEEGSALARLIAAGKLQEASEEQCRRQYALLCAKLSEAGYRHYEISNWAIPGHEARHNSAYWTRHPYVGLGPSAHSLEITADGKQRRSWNSSFVSGWKEEGAEVLSEEEIREERIMLGLRTDAGAEVDGRHVVIPESDWFVSDEIIAGLL
ncbi:MAG: coproporphyrinogen III oxidase family protein [Bacteroidales bacterium]|nr:coproporphyrinogen III oxidase family protein [Bacteroidales bacterium]